MYQCKKLVRNINSKKPLGPSNIPAWALKDSVDIVGEPLTFLINAFLHEGRFPNHLRRADVVPIYKSGDIEDPTNYRPISIPSALSKVFEKVIQNQIVEFLVRRTCELVQYADDTFIFVRGKKIEDAINLLEKTQNAQLIFFHRHRLNLNDKKLNLSFSAGNPRKI